MDERATTDATGRERDPGAEGEAATESAQIPTSTYRLQLNGAFTFQDAERIVPYLDDLGVGALYASPYFAAAPGSGHGYDVVDYDRLNPEVGSEAEHAAMTASLRQHGLLHLLDFVPNHMGIAGGRNPWWNDVLENGPSSPYADFFDIDWRPLKPELRNKVLLPILGDQYGAVLERGELTLRLDDGALRVDYFETPLPLAPPTYPLVLRRRLDELLAALPEDDPDLLEFQSIVTAFERLPAQEERDPELVAERLREQIVAKRRLADLLAASRPVREAVAAAVTDLNGDPADPDSYDVLDQLLAAQSYRLAFWRVAGEEINYRRFFAINELGAIRQEVPEVFAATHGLLLRLLAAGAVTGVRIDHPDGLWDPAGYFRALQEARVAVRDDGEAPPVPDDPEGTDLPLYLVVEKILEHGESLPSDWAVHGTVGYEFATAIGGLFVDGAGRRPFDELYARFIGEKPNFADMVYGCKLMIMRTALVSELNVLAQALNRISEEERHTRDFTLNTLREALRETIACFPVYRTYVVCDQEEAEPVLDRDRRYVDQATAAAKRRNPAVDPSVLEFLRDVLLSGPEGARSERARDERCRFAMKFQQLTGPVMAKGLEDTAFYRYNRLVALNEVGGDPSQFGTSLAGFHRQNTDRRRRWPDAMLTTSTHDTKRSEDVRARIAVLSESPREWRAAINRWARLNRRHKTRVDGRPAPDRNDEYLLYQTLLGVWPVADDDDGDDDNSAELVERVVAFMIKAQREAQLHTTWTAPNVDYETATEHFVRALLDPKSGAPFLDDAAPPRAKVAHFGAFNALAQQLLKLTSPGVPDIYQGTELWDFSLVDPDNRRPVDFAQRVRLLRALGRRRPSPKLARELVAEKADGRIKLFLTRQALACRREHPDLFARGDYLPLEGDGLAADHLCAFARRLTDRADAGEVVVAVPRLTATLCRGELIAPLGGDVWADSALPLPHAPPGTAYRDRFTSAGLRTVAADGEGSRLPLAVLFAAFPVALLERIEPA